MSGLVFRPDIYTNKARCSKTGGSRSVWTMPNRALVMISVVLGDIFSGKPNIVRGQSRNALFLIGSWADQLVLMQWSVTTTFNVAFCRNLSRIKLVPL